MELNDKIHQLGQAFEQFKTANDARLAEIAKNNTATGLTIEKVEKANEHISQLETKISELAVAFNRMPQGGQPGQTEAQKMEGEYKKALQGYIRKGVQLPVELIQFATKTMSTDSDADGGFFVSAEMSSEIIKKVYESTPIRQLASVQTISTNELEIPYDGDEAGSGWVGEVGTRSNTSTPQIKQIKIPVHELYANPLVTQKLLDDANVNIEAWLGAKMAEKFARDEATAFVSGDGVVKPKGILKYASGTSFDQVERVTTAANNAITGDDLIDLQGALKEPYQPNACFLINRSIVKGLRKLKDSVSGNYMWQPGLTAGQPSQLLDKPVYFSSDFPSAIVATTDMLVYGDIKAGYQIVDRIGVRTLRDPFSSKPYVQFYTTKRTGGGVKNFEAIKILLQKT